MKTNYLEEFPDFDYALPDLGEGWEDTSWHNDSCPSMDYSLGDNYGLRIWFQYSNPEWRECGGEKYILVIGDYGDSDHLMESDDLGEILAYIQANKLTEAKK